MAVNNIYVVASGVAFQLGVNFINFHYEMTQFSL